MPEALPICAVLGLDTSRRHRTMADLSARQGAPNVGVQSPEDLRSIYEHPPGVTGQGTSVAILGNGATDSVIADLHAFDAEHGTDAAGNVARKLPKTAIRAFRVR